MRLDRALFSLMFTASCMRIGTNLITRFQADAAPLVEALNLRIKIPTSFTFALTCRAK
jgi:hypothetical protein